MNSGHTVFRQLLQLLPRHEFDLCVRRYRGNYKAALPAPVITEIYKQRWQVELFFKWVKQHLRIKTFCGTSINAVKSQIWVALSVYLLVVIAKKRLGISCPLYTFLQILEVNLFEKKPIPSMVADVLKQISNTPSDNQLNLFSY